MVHVCPISIPLFLLCLLQRFIPIKFHNKTEGDSSIRVLRSRFNYLTRCCAFQCPGDLDAWSTAQLLALFLLKIVKWRKGESAHNDSGIANNRDLLQFPQPSPFHSNKCPFHPCYGLSWSYPRHVVVFTQITQVAI